jgi:hypothetical protein
MAALAVMLACAPAEAAKIAPVVRAAGAGSDKAATFVAHYVRELLRDDPRYEVVDPSERLGGAGSDAAKAFAEALNLVKKARSAYETLELDAAVDDLTAALQRYEKNAADLLDVKPVADALVLLGAVHILRGEDKTGTERLSQSSLTPASSTPRCARCSKRLSIKCRANPAAP